MPNAIPTEVIYDDTLFLSRPELGVCRWKASVAGTITEMYLWADDVIGLPASREAFFNVRKNGVKLFSNPQRMELTPLDPDTTKTGLSIPVAIGDEISLDLERIRVARVVAPVTFLMITEE